jgi:hypothetical protein
MDGKTVSPLGHQRLVEQFVPAVSKAVRIAPSLIVTLLLLSLASLAYADQPQQIIDIQHDSAHGATCWILNDRAISCLPDRDLKQATPSSEVGRASKTDFLRQNGPLQATPIEVFQL